jgi:hypothetical protein
LLKLHLRVAETDGAKAMGALADEREQRAATKTGH